VIANLQCVVLDCSDALELAQFYQSLLGGVINQAEAQRRAKRKTARSPNTTKIAADQASDSPM
jgi:hypothetical protein